ncbi:MAG: MFS transporter [Cyanobacteria bacterium P01_H01_bin.21]
MDSSTPVLEQSTVLIEPTSPKPKFKFWQLWNMNLGFLGIQFGWGLQMANMSAIFEHLGAHAHQLPILWIAAPLTGLIVQPIVGNLSDYTWGPLGRRRPYFLIGAILATVALTLMPHASELWMAAILLWLLDTSANISMEPYRAFVGDLLPRDQRTQGFATQSLMIGLGAVSASILPWMLNHIFGIASTANGIHEIPPTIEISFYIGAGLFLATILWTIFTTDERPPRDLQAFEKLQAQRGGLIGSIQQTYKALQQIPAAMRKLAYVQSLTWLGIFCFFLYFPPAVARNIFGAIEQGSVLYSDGIEWAGLCFAVFNISCAGFSLLIPSLSSRFGKQLLYSLCLSLGGVSLISVLIFQNRYWALLAMIGFGVTWAGVLSLPYSMLVNAIPPGQKGIYMGIFNFSIVLPEILISLGFGWLMKHLLHDDRMVAVGVGGIFLMMASILMTHLPFPSLAKAKQFCITRQNGQFSIVKVARNL